MTNLSDAADILKSARTQQQAQASKQPTVVTSLTSDSKAKPTITSAVYNLTSPSGKVVKMTGDDKDVNPGKTTIAE